MLARTNNMTPSPCARGPVLALRSPKEAATAGENSAVVRIVKCPASEVLVRHYPAQSSTEPPRARLDHRATPTGPVQKKATHRMPQTR